MAAASSPEGFVGATAARPIDKAAASGSGSDGDRVVDCGPCAICLDRITLQETALVKRCEHACCAPKMHKGKRSLKRNESIDDLTRGSKMNKITYLTRSSTKNKTIRNGETTKLLISGDLESNQDVE